MSGNKILKHTDSNVWFVKHNKLIHRYQIYLDGSDENVLYVDDEHKNSVDWNDSIIDFALEQPHYYVNNSNKPWLLLVFDILNTELL